MRGLRAFLLSLAALAAMAPLAAGQAAGDEGALRAALAAAPAGTERLRLLGQLAREIGASGSDEAVRVAEEARALGRELRDPVAEGHALVDLALARRARGEYGLALDSGDQALRLAREIGNLRLAARAHNILGLAENSRDEPAAALRHGLEELRIFEGLGERHGLSQSLNNVGNSYRRLGEHAKALDHHRRSLAIKLELGDRGGAGYSHHNIGEVLFEQGAHAEALEAYARAEAEWRAVDDRRALAAALKSQGLALEALGRLVEALGRLEASLALRRDPPNAHGEAETLLSLGRVQLRLGRPGESAASCRKALAIAEGLDQTTLIGDALAGLAAAEAASGNVRAAGGLLEKQLALQQRLRGQERSRVRSEMRATLEAHAAQRRSERLEQQARLHDEALRRGVAERNQAIVAAVLLLATAGFALNGYRLKRASGERYRRQATELEGALAQVKTLSGLLPLCAWCHKKVRDQEGRWGPIEAYVQEHTHAVVTHSICPECQAANFPARTGEKGGGGSV
jgi:tetratricopeptide (TPR) repeat protein